MCLRLCRRKTRKSGMFRRGPASWEWCRPARVGCEKVSSMVIKNPDLIPELTEYAEQTAKVELC